MDFSVWRRQHHLSIEEIVDLPVGIAQVGQGSCPTLAIAQHVRMKLYRRYEDPVILTWKLLDGDEGGLPTCWWWLICWEDPLGVRVCIREINEARDQCWRWVLCRHLPVPASGQCLLK